MARLNPCDSIELSFHAHNRHREPGDPLAGRLEYVRHGPTGDPERERDGTVPFQVPQFLRRLPGPESSMHQFVISNPPDVELVLSPSLLERHDTDVVCINCDKRAVDCRFSRTKGRKSRTTRTAQARDRTQTEGQSTSSGAAEPVTPMSQARSTPASRIQRHSHTPLLPSSQLNDNSATDCLVSESLAESCHATFDHADGVLSPTPADHPVIMPNEQDVCSSSLAYFSHGKLTALSRTLGHNRVAELIKRIESAVRSRIRHSVKIFPSPDDYANEARSITLREELRSKYIESYFEEIHPIYPFLDRTSFEEKASSPRLMELLSVDNAWCALYHAILSLGSLYHDCGSLTAFSGTAWDIFRVSLTLFSRIIFGRRTLVAAQAMTAMAIFGVTYVSLPIEDVLVTEAARIATSLQMTRSGADETSPDFQRTFWVIYSLESEFCFNTGRASSIPSHDISCPIPQTTLPFLPDFNWLRFLSAYAQMISRIYERLFSVKARSLSKESRRTEAARAFEELEHWKNSAPEDFRPGLPVKAHRLGKPQAVALAIQIHFYYHNVRIALSRVSILASARDHENPMRYKLTLTESARAIIDLVHLIHHEPFVSPLIQYHMPQTALLLLFDFVIEHPLHPETRQNLSYLQMVASYFTRLQYATENDVYGTIPTEFLQIAAKFVEDMAVSQASGTQAGEDPTGVDLWPSHNDGMDLGVLDELLAYQGFTFSIHNNFMFEEADFWLSGNDTAAFPEAGSGFDFADFTARPNPETEQGNPGR
ncbi:hypothetical protein FOVG_17960 [Fusarium oxysporum f. sp. pisi HDV247]|uniref:Xylanolytic transcriptional activator regulatory domain-containing protein n=1 Tax=Fusarium oxysporum f. sp. pisi HDV247 TaxID=1080344 RepID=W9NSB7_FUSOX|nr:hypothetical protein FOVG_17960 [Fusarium oxysporum f. sp. pisi HDV247]